MPRRPIRAVIFDLDGTLTAPGLIDFAGIRREIACPTHHDILSWVEHLDRTSPPAADAARLVIDSYELAALANVSPAPGLYEALDRLRSLALPLAVLTRNSQRSLGVTIDRLQLGPYFEHHLAREGAQPKPHPEGVLRLAEAMKVPPEHALMVGDYRHDVTAGYAAGAWTAWVKTLPDEAPPHGTDFVVEHLSVVCDIAEGHPQAWSAPVMITQRGG